MFRFQRVFTIVMDSVGVGAAWDADQFDDVGSDTFGHIAANYPGLKIDHLASLGMANLHPLQGVEPAKNPTGYYTKMIEKSNGKDTMTGHWEMMGLYTEIPFQTFTDTGFPQELLDELTKRTGHGILCNKSASGTQVLDDYGEEHMKSGDMIVYTSADSVLQIAAHEETFGLEELYRCCEIARELTREPKWMVGRIIARPFLGNQPGQFKRTSNRHDYALKPSGKTTLNALKDANLDVISVGKIFDIFDGEGLTANNKIISNEDGMNTTIEIAKQDFQGLCFVNLVDFDALWGHRRDVVGYAKEIELFDRQLGEFLPLLRNDDLLIVTADHGNDPTFKGTDHTREMVPFLAYSPSFVGSGLIPVSKTFADIGATIADNFGVTMPAYGVSKLAEMK